MAFVLRFVAILVALRLLANKVDGSSQEVAKLLKEAPKNNSYDDLLQAVLADQQANYIEPIGSMHTRQPISLNGLYDFCFDPEAGLVPSERVAKQPLKAACQLGNFYRMPVPAAFNEILTNETAKNYMGWMWYQRVVALAEDRGKPDSNWLVQFDSINYLAIIWGQIIDDNGEPKSEARILGSHVGGHLPIVVNVSELVHSAKPLHGINLRLSIAVTNLLNENTVPSGRLIDMSNVVGRRMFKFEPDFDFFHFAGIMGDVQLLHLPRYYIKKAKLIDTNRLEICFAGGSLIDITDSYQLPFGLIDIDNLQIEGIKFDSNNLVAISGGQHFCTLWSYDCSLRKFNKLCSKVNQLREWPHAEWGQSVRIRESYYNEGDDGHELLERDVYDMKLSKRADLQQVIRKSARQLQGFGMHHEQLFSGRSMSLAAIMKDLQLLKETGANVLRTSHYPYSPAYLDACDELGIMVIAECPAVGLKSFSALKLKLHKETLREMMLRDHEHPSIVMWSLANEPESQKAEARAYFQQLVDYARNQLAEFTTKSGRPLTAAIAQSHEADRIGDLLDIIMVNRYYGWYDYTGTLEAIRPELNKSLLGWAKRYGKPLILSEFGADTVAGMHSGELFSEQFQRDLIEEYERVFDQLAAVQNKTELDFLGAMIWNFADFSTHESLLRVGGNKKGIFTADRKAKMAAESVKRIFRRRAGLDDATRKLRTEL